MTVSVTLTTFPTSLANSFQLYIGLRLTREKPLNLDEESIYLNNISEKLQQIICFRPTTSSVVFTHLPK